MLDLDRIPKDDDLTVVLWLVCGLEAVRARQPQLFASGSYVELAESFRSLLAQHGAELSEKSAIGVCICLHTARSTSLLRRWAADLPSIDTMLRWTK